jgi:hypothetical protein
VNIYHANLRIIAASCVKANGATSKNAAALLAVDKYLTQLETNDMALKELLAAEAAKLTKAVADVQAAKDAELKALSDAGRVVSVDDGAKLLAGGSVIDAADTKVLLDGLAADGLKPDGSAITPVTPAA